MELQPQILQMFKDNEGNKITPAIIRGMTTDIQIILNELCNQAFEAGRQQERNAATGPLVEKVAAEPVN